MYDFAASKEAVALASSAAPEGHTVRSATSTLAKILQWHQEKAIRPEERVAHDIVLRLPIGQNCRLSAQLLEVPTAVVHLGSAAAARALNFERSGRGQALSGGGDA